MYCLDAADCLRVGNACTARMRICAASLHLHPLSCLDGDVFFSLLSSPKLSAAPGWMTALAFAVRRCGLHRLAVACREALEKFSKLALAAPASYSHVRRREGPFLSSFALSERNRLLMIQLCWYSETLGKRAKFDFIMHLLFKQTLFSKFDAFNV